MKAEFDNQKQLWRVIIPAKFTIEGEEKIMFFRNKEFANDVEPRIEDITAEPRRGRPRKHESRKQILNERTRLEIQKDLDRLQKWDAKKEPPQTALILGSEEIDVLERILRALCKGQIVCMKEG
jgi:hypothetical protein